MVKMSTVEEFIASPSEEILDLCTKEQLLKIAMKKHYGIDVSNFSLTFAFHVDFKFNV